MNEEEKGNKQKIHKVCNFCYLFEESQSCSL